MPCPYGRIAWWLGDRLAAGAVSLAPDVTEAAEAPVNAGQPDDRLAAVMSIIMPGPAGNGNVVARLHRKWLSLDDRNGANVALDDKPNRCRRVPVRGRCLAGHEHVDSQAERRRRSVAQGGVQQLYAPPAIGVEGYRGGSLLQTVIDVGPPPEKRGKLRERAAFSSPITGEVVVGYPA